MGSSHVFHQYTLQLLEGDRNMLVAKLQEREVPAMIYYPVPLHMQKAYRDDRYAEGNFPVTEQLCDRVFSLPMHSELSREQQDLIIDAVKAALS